MTDTTPAALAALTQPIRDALTANSYSWLTVAACKAAPALIAALDALAQERDANALDAARYRWLRSLTNRYGEVDLFDDLGREMLGDENLDFAIDAALQGAKP